MPLRHINVGEWVKERALHEGYDPEWQSYTVDEDRVSVLFNYLMHRGSVLMECTG